MKVYLVANYIDYEGYELDGSGVNGKSEKGDAMVFANYSDAESYYNEMRNEPTSIGNWVILDFELK